MGWGVGGGGLCLGRCVVRAHACCACACVCGRTNGQVRDIVVVHDVKVDDIGATCDLIAFHEYFQERLRTRNVVRA